MKKSEFKKIIKESVKEVLEEHLEELIENKTTTKQTVNEDDNNAKLSNYYKQEEQPSNSNKFESLKKKNPVLGNILQEVDDANKRGNGENLQSDMGSQPRVINENQNQPKPEGSKSHVEKALTRDYSSLVKKMDEKRREKL